MAHELIGFRFLRRRADRVTECCMSNGDCSVIKRGISTAPIGTWIHTLDHCKGGDYSDMPYYYCGRHARIHAEECHEPPTDI